VHELLRLSSATPRCEKRETRAQREQRDAAHDAPEVMNLVDAARRFVDDEGGGRGNERRVIGDDTADGGEHYPCDDE
jgi:hypothetical protein